MGTIKTAEKVVFAFKYRSIEEIFRDKGLAKLGDSLVNLVYSLAKSRMRNKPDGWKVPGKVLAEAIRKAELKEFAPRRSDAHSLGDSAEGLIAYVWLAEILTLEEISQILEEEMKKWRISNRRSEIQMAIEAFTVLLKNIRCKIGV
ncbi:MAG: ribonuclease III family protein [Promethearchaeota archaeon]